jgi:hypothetical protein
MATIEMVELEVEPGALAEPQGPPEARALHRAMATIELEAELGVGPGAGLALEAAVGAEVDCMG